MPGPDFLLATFGSQLTATVPSDGGPLPMQGVPFQSGGTAKLGADPTFVFRPGGVAGGNVYTSWAAMMADVALLSGPKWIEYDPTIQQCIVPAGIWNVDDCRFVTNVANGPGGSPLNEDLIFAQGAQFTFTSLYMFGNCTFRCQSTQSVWTPPQLANGTGAQLWMYDAATIVSDAGFAAWGNITTLSAAPPFIFMQFQATIGDGTHAAFNITHTFGLTIATAGQVTIAANALSGAGFPTIITTGDATIGNQATSPSLNQFPTNEVQATAVAGGAAATQTIATGNIARIRTGLVRVSAQQTVTTSAAASVTFQLQRDGSTNIGPAIVQQVTAAVALAQSIDFFDVLPDGANHTYNILATTSAGTITQGTNSGSISVDEK